MSNLPENIIYNTATESFVDASGYTDANGNLVAPPGYSFVQAEVSSMAGAMGVPMAAPMNPGMFTPMGYSQAYPMNTPMNTPYMMNTPNFHSFYSTPQHHSEPHSFPPKYANNRRPHQNPEVNVKEKFVEATYDAIRTSALRQGIWVDVREEDEGYHTVRVHAKKKGDIAVLPMIIQKVISEIGLVEVSVHYIRMYSKRSRCNLKHGLTIYMKTQASNEDTLATIQEFKGYKIHARRVREKPEGTNLEKGETPKAPRRKSKSRSMLNTDKKKSRCLNTDIKLKSRSITLALVNNARTSKKSIADLGLMKPMIQKMKFKVSSNSSNQREFPDEDPDLGDELSKNLSISLPTRSNPSVEKEESRTIPVLIPTKEDKLQLKFKDGSKRIVTYSAGL